MWKFFAPEFSASGIEYNQKPLLKSGVRGYWTADSPPVSNSGHYGKEDKCGRTQQRPTGSARDG